MVWWISAERQLSWLYFEECIFWAITNLLNIIIFININIYFMQNEKVDN